MRDPVALEAQDKAGFQCGLATLNNGQCSGQYVELHHMTYRSHGGGDEVENILPLCSKHHAAIHDRGKPLLDDEHGQRYYQLQNDEGEFTRWYLFEDVEHKFIAREGEIHRDLETAALVIDFTRYGMAQLLAEIDGMNLYSLRKYDSAVDYAQGEFGIPEHTARPAILAGHFLIANPHLLDRMRESLYFSALKGALGSLKRLPGDTVEAEVDRMIELQRQGVRVASIVESVKEAAGRASLHMEWEVVATVSANSQSTLMLQVYAANEEKAAEAFKRVALRGAPVSDLLTISVETVRKI